MEKVNPVVFIDLSQVIPSHKALVLYVFINHFEYINFNYGV